MALLILVLAAVAASSQFDLDWDWDVASDKEKNATSLCDTRIPEHLLKTILVEEPKRNPRALRVQRTLLRGRPVDIENGKVVADADGTITHPLFLGEAAVGLLFFAGRDSEQNKKEEKRKGDQNTHCLRFLYRQGSRRRKASMLAGP